MIPLRRHHQPLRHTRLLNSTKPLEITNITNFSNCIIPPILVNPNGSILRSFTTLTLSSEIQQSEGF